MAAKTLHSRPVVKRRRYSAEELYTIKALKESGYTYRQIAEKLNRSTRSVSVTGWRIKNEEPIKVYTTNNTVTVKGNDIKPSLESFSFDEILAYLYDNGYRIVNGNFVRIVPVSVNNKSFIVSYA